MKKSTALFILVAFILVIFMAGCQEQKNPNKKTVKIEVSGEKYDGTNTKIFGNLKPDNPSGAGFANRSFEIVIPGSVECEAGPANYEVSVMAWNPKTMKLKVFVDGEELKPPKILLNITEGSYSGMFTIDNPEGEQPKK